MAKIAYRVRNWKDYNQALINRGNLNVWISEDVDKTWYAKLDGSRGRPKIYSDACIGLMLTIRSLFHLPLRASQGFFASVSDTCFLFLSRDYFLALSIDLSHLIASFLEESRSLVITSGVKASL